jgi:IS5 family transposase
VSPRQTAADGGFASRHNLGKAKALGVRDVTFHKKAGLRVMDMVKSNWVYRKLRNFRAGIKSEISGAGASGIRRSSKISDVGRRDRRHSTRAIGSGSMLTPAHHEASSP